jgi:hypothetical protein
MRKFLIWTGKYYTPKYLTQPELCDIINKKYDRPILNSAGEMLTTEDTDWSEE